MNGSKSGNVKLAEVERTARCESEEEEIVSWFLDFSVAFVFVIVIVWGWTSHGSFFRIILGDVPGIIHGARLETRVNHAQGKYVNPITVSLTPPPTP